MARKTERARTLRRDPSRAEKICWDLLRAHRMADLKFRRQHTIGPYFADFACVSRKLVIEIDGGFHDDQIDADVLRTVAMENSGWRVLRFAASEVVQNREGIWAMIDMALQEPASPLSPPLPLAGERSMRCIRLHGHKAVKPPSGAAMDGAYSIHVEQTQPDDRCPGFGRRVVHFAHRGRRGASDAGVRRPRALRRLQDLACPV